MSERKQEGWEQRSAEARIIFLAGCPGGVEVGVGWGGVWGWGGGDILSSAKC